MNEVSLQRVAVGGVPPSGSDLHNPLISFAYGSEKG
jgi:hypothetical protein